jgi:hypothetical protein
MALGDDKVNEARAAATELSAPKRGAAVTPPLPKVAEFDTVMRAFTREKLGGLGMEDYLNTLLELKGDVAPAEAEKIASFAHKNVVIAHLATGYPPETDNGQKTRKNWSAFSHDMHAAAQNLAKAAQTRSGEAIGAAATKLSDACAKCHDVFR